MFFSQNITRTVQKGYGYLYNGYAASHANFAPSGWRIPTYWDFDTLITYMIANGYNYDDSTSGNKIGKALADRITWTLSSITGAVGNTDYDAKRNISGFTILGAGRRFATDGAFNYIGEDGFLLAPTDVAGSLVLFGMFCTYNNINLDSATYDMRYGFSARLIKNSTSLSDGESSTMTDYDGNVYDTICIGTQEWTVQNWKCTKL